MNKKVAWTLIAFLLLLMFTPFVCSAKDPMKVARRNYIPIVKMCPDDPTPTFGSAVTISKNRALTATHLVKCMFMTKNELGSVIWSEGDTAIVEFPDGDFSPLLEFGEARVGDRLFSISNGFVSDGIYLEFYAALIGDEGITVSPCPPMGSSGAGVYTKHGKLVGIISNVMTDQFCAGVGLVLPIPDEVKRAVYPK